MWATRKRRILTLLLLDAELDDELIQNEIADGQPLGSSRQCVKRQARNAFNILQAELCLEGVPSYANWMRMSPEIFYDLLELVAPKLEKRWVVRKPISAAERLSISLRFLATGRCFNDLAAEFGVSERSVSYIVRETCIVLFETLQYTFNTPKTHNDWLEIANEFYTQWQVPNCLGAIAGKHIRLRQPLQSGSQFRNHGAFDSVVLMAVADANLTFRCIDVGTNGRISDGGVWNKCGLNTKLQNGSLNLPEPACLPGTDVSAPYVFIADDAFPLGPNLMKPYARTGQTGEKISNYRISRARRCVESAFGIAAARFRCLQTALPVQPAFAVVVTKAVCALHNFLCSATIYSRSYIPSGFADSESANGDVFEGTYRNELIASNFAALAPTSDASSIPADENRDKFLDWFVSNAGAVPWQMNKIN